MESKKNSRLRWMLGVLCMLYAGSMFADEALIDDIVYEIRDDGTAKLLSTYAAVTSVVIPETIEFEGKSYVLTEISERAFGHQLDLVSVTIEMPLEAIPVECFIGCMKLSSVNLPETVVSIGDYAFSNCQALTDLDFFPANLKYVGAGAFSGCSGLKEIAIRKGLEYGDNAFGNCSGATSMIIEDIPQGSNTNFWYYGCENLKTLRIEDSKEILSIGSLPDAPFEEVYIGRNLTDTPFENCKYSIETVTFGECVTSVPNSIFENSTNLNSVVFGNNINYIGWSAFANTSLKSVSIPTGVDTLYSNTFSNNGTLASITLPQTLKHIGHACFSGSAITNVTFPNNIVNIDGFNDCESLETIVIPEGAESIEPYAFSGCKSLKSISIPDKVTKIGDHAFSLCKDIEHIAIGKGVKEIGDGAFYECYTPHDVYYNGSLSDWCRITMDVRSYPEDTNPLGEAINFYVKNDGIGYKEMKNLIIPNDIDTIKPYAFSGCKAFNTVTILENVREVGEEAFWSCTSIDSLYINAEKIGDYAFHACQKLKMITIGNNVKSIGRFAFQHCALSHATKFNGDMKEWFKIKRGDNALPCGELTIDNELIVSYAPEQLSVIEVPARAFYGCSSLKSVNLPFSVKKIGESAFCDCDNLIEATAKGATKIGDYAFAYCDNLTKANLVLSSATRGSDSDAIYIGASVFSGCAKLGEIALPENIAYIGSYAFDNTLWFNNLSDGPVYLGSILYTYKGEMPENTTITVKDGTTMICEWAFSSQYNLIGISLPQTIANIGDYAFSYSGLKSFEIPASVDTIPRGLLSNCYNLRSLTISSGVNFVSRSAFDGCDSLENIHIADAETPLVWEGYYLAYTDMYGGMYFPMAPEGWGFPNSYPKNLYLGRDMESPTLIYDMGYGEQSYRMYLSDLFHTDSLRTLTIGKDVTTLNLPTMPLYPEWNEKYEFWGYTTPLREITCLATVPPTFPVDDNGEVYDPFIHPDADEWAVDFIKAVIPLSVPQEAVEAYKNADVWKGFYQIDGKDFTGIAAVQTETNSDIHYDISGRIVAPDMPGIHIIRNADGSTRKILVR